MPVVVNSYHRRMIFVLPLTVIGLAIAGAAVEAQPWRTLVFFASTTIAAIGVAMHLA